MIDEVQIIAHARAAMLQRGYDPLRLLIGPDMLSRLRRDHAGYVNERSQSVLDMPFRSHDDMEGFAVVFDPQGGGL